MMRLLEEMRKNALTLLRSPAALVTLVLGPLTLLLLVGVALSGTTPNGIKLGVTGTDTLSLNASLQNFPDLNRCLGALRNQDIHMCLEFTEVETIRGIPQGTVIFHVDESRERISSLVLNDVTGQLGIESSKIRVEAVKGLLDKFGQIAAFMSEKRSDLQALRQNALDLRTNLSQRETQLINDQAIYRAAYYPVRDSLMDATSSIDQTNAQLQLLINTTQNLLLTPSVGNDTDISDLRGRLENLSGKANQSTISVDESHALVNPILAALADIDVQLENEINATRTYKASIDIGVSRIDESVLQLDKDIQELSKLDPSLAHRIDQPIIQQVQTLFEDLRPIQAGFAQLFCIVIMFISTLFGAIVTLMEINSRAVLRNTLSPTSEIGTMIALGITGLIVVAVQGTVLIIVAQTILDIDVMSSLRELAGIGTLLAMTFIIIGMSIALMLRKEQASILVATFTALVVLFFSDVMNAIELMPVTVASFVRQSPLVVASTMLKKNLLFGNIITIDQIIPLFIALAIALILICAAYRRYKSRISRW